MATGKGWCWCPQLHHHCLCTSRGKAKAVTDANSLNLIKKMDENLTTLKIIKCCVRDTTLEDLSKCKKL